MPRPTLSATDQEQMRTRWRAGVRPSCPVCGVPVIDRPVPTPEGVSYVRRRSWLTCPRCGRQVIADDAREGPPCT
ncbi:MAG: hypothetical protein RQ751_12735 [Longimicrobiales bacterium]|nr:hypothetical protein [Longimicrobiales bacterium]